MPPKKAAGSASKKSTTSKPTTNGVAKSKATKKAPAKATATSTTRTGAEAPTKRTRKTTAKAATKAPTQTATKTASKTIASTIVAANTSKKRKAPDDEQEEEHNGKTAKRARTATKSATPAPAATKRKAAANKAPVKAKTVLNTAPTQRLDIYVFGNGEQAELGLGPDPKTTRKVKRPRLHPSLDADKVGVVALSTGGMHTAVLTHDNKILTWGVNDQGALGRDTAWEGGERDIADDKSDSDSEEEALEPLNPYESTPGQVDVSALPSDIVWTQLACTDSATFALTDDGLIYGWGTFRGNDGIFGFRPTTDGNKPEAMEDRIEQRPMLVERLKDVTQVAAGDNHVLALTNKGEVYAWGAGQQNQLGRRITERHLMNGVIPTAFGLKKDIVLIGAGAYHSFAVHKNGTVYAWGLSNMAQTGIAKDAGGGSLVECHLLAVVKSLSKFGKVICIDGGLAHSVAVTDKGELLVWGRLDGSQLGLDIASLPEADIHPNFATKKPEGLKVPTQIPGIDAHQAAAGSDHCVAVAKDGKAYAWGFSVNYQTGLGTDDEVKMATYIDNTATRGKQLIEAGCGGQFSVLAGLAGVNNQVNGA